MLNYIRLIAILSSVVVAPWRSAIAAEPAATFEDRVQASGVEAILNRSYAHAAAWSDVNGDGYPDLYWGSFGQNTGPDRLLINQRDGTFIESPQKAINRTGGRASGAAFADLDNDGHVDLVIVNNFRTRDPDGNFLLRNDGKGNFTDVTAGCGLELPNFSGRSTLILDFDGDGLLDLFLQHDMFGGQPGVSRSVLLRNQGKMKFSDATREAGLPNGDNELVGLGGACGDFNGDGWPDLLLANSGLRADAPRNEQWRADVRLYLNNRKSRFVLASTFDFSATFPWFGNGEDWICGASGGDLNNDGRMDAVIGVHYGSSVDRGVKGQAVAVRAFLNTGNDDAGYPNWQDITDASGIKALSIKQPHVEIQDFNNDGTMDLWNGAAMMPAAGRPYVPYVQYNQGSNAQGVPQFAPAPGLVSPGITQEIPERGKAGHLRYFAASPTADYDLDGRLDIFGADFHVPAESNHSFLFRNTTANPGNYLAVRIDRGSGVPNRFGIGAVVRVYQAGKAGNAAALLGTQSIDVGNGYCSGRPAVAHFGVPGRGLVDIVVQLPSGGPSLTITGIKTDQVFTVSK